jgi:hypothetical protein
MPSPITNTEAGSSVRAKINTAFTELATAQTDIAGKLDAALADAITDTKASPVDGDQLIMLDSADGGAPKLVTKAQLLAGVGGGGGGSAVGLWDYWDEARIGHAGVASGVFTASAVSGGSNSNSPDSTYFDGHRNLGALLRSTTTANSGFRYSSAQTTSVVFTGGTGNKFRAQFMWLDSFTDRIVRAGYIDSFNNVDSTDGAYFEIIGNSTLTAKTAANGTRTTAATTYTLTLGISYTLDIDVAADGLSARFRVYAGTSETAVFDETITTNLPSGTARSFGVGLFALSSGTTAVNLGMIYSIGCGTIPGFARARG